VQQWCGLQKVRTQEDADLKKYDLQMMDVIWDEARSAAGDSKKWNALIAQCSSGNKKIQACQRPYSR